ncbi:MAG: M20 family metallopeptidase [Candidatus Nanopelagicales bacterium]
MSAHDAVRSSVAARREELLALSHRIHAHPETAWQEHRAAGWVGEAMDGGGFDVEPAYLGLDTALRATTGSGPLHVVLCAEYDALPGLGHACGHNIIAASSVGAALALGAVADDLGLTVTLLGTPAEEGGGGKVVMLERGAFEGVHLALMAHPGPVDVARARPYAVSHLDIAYDGKAAHAAAYPEDGVNAADAFTVAQVAIGLLRQQLPPGARVHGLVTRHGEAPNAIPQRSEGRWYVRGDSTALMESTREKVLRCFEAGAIATGCALHVEEPTAPYAELRTDDEVLALYVRNATDLGRAFSDGDTGLGRMSRASTDMGNVSQVVPTIHPYVGIGSAPAVNHQAEFAAACVTPTADAALLDAATALALTVVDAATDDAVRMRLLG